MKFYTNFQERVKYTGNPDRSRSNESLFLSSSHQRECPESDSGCFLFPLSISGICLPPTAPSIVGFLGSMTRNRFFTQLRSSGNDSSLGLSSFGSQKFVSTTKPKTPRSRRQITQTQVTESSRRRVNSKAKRPGWIREVYGGERSSCHGKCSYICWDTTRRDLPWSSKRLFLSLRSERSLVESRIFSSFRGDENYPEITAIAKHPILFNICENDFLNRETQRIIFIANFNVQKIMNVTNVS